MSNLLNSQNQAKVDILYFASASRRFSVRLLDAIFMFIVELIFCFIFYALCNVHENVLTNIKQSLWYQFDIFLVIIFLLNLLYFVLLPLLWKGQTIFGKLLHVRIIQIVKSNKFWWQLIFRDFFVWIDFSLLLLFFSIILTFVSNDGVDVTMQQLVNLQPDSSASIGLQVMHWLFKILLVFCIFVSLFIIGNTIYNSRYQSAYDTWTQTAVVNNRKPKKIQAKNNEKKVETTPTVLPGKIDGELERID